MSNLFKKIKQFLEGHPKDKRQLHARLDEMDGRLMHIEDTLVDYRNVLLKLVKQGNSIIKFLSDLDSDPYGNVETKIELVNTEGDKKEYYMNLAKEFEKRFKKLGELEKELEKYKEQITPGQVGEA